MWGTIRYKLKGYRVVLLNVAFGLPVLFDALASIVNGLMGIDLTPILPPGSGKYVATVLAILNITLRVFGTTGPFGTKEGLRHPPDGTHV